MEEAVRSEQRWFLAARAHLSNPLHTNDGASQRVWDRYLSKSVSERRHLERLFGSLGTRRASPLGFSRHGSGVPHRVVIPDAVQKPGFSLKTRLLWNKRHHHPKAKGVARNQARY